MIDQIKNKYDESLYHPETVVGEFSGRDSVAAILKAYEEGTKYILPIATFAGTEYGDFNSIFRNYQKLAKRVESLYGQDKVLYPLIEYNDQYLWRLINGRFISRMVEKFGFYNPCLGCHLYFHLTKLPFAKKLSKKIISGERESHDGKIKVNQLHDTLETYKAVLKVMNYELIMPLQTIKDGHKVEELIGWDWQEGKDHPKCVLSGNYRDHSGKAIYDQAEHSYFLDQYIYEMGIQFARYVLKEIDEEQLLKHIEEKL